MIKNVFFDLDGTLTHPEEGITKSIQYAYAQMGHESPSREDLRLQIGPSLHDYFRDIFGIENVEIAIDHYRQRYDRENMCLLGNSLYPEIIAVLHTLRLSGKRLWLVTAKPLAIAQRIVCHFDLDHFFEKLYGAELNGMRSNKSDLIKYILTKEKFLPEAAIMVGDRKHDIIGAAENNMKSIGVSWGYGSVAELETAGASYIVHQPADLLEILLEQSL